ncbi:hypothetical protein CY35_13G038500 [Sphagnum magellanicum]|nr:hypothetical protein CY35_13G038500 [Sphagnum magellanicum]
MTSRRVAAAAVVVIIVVVMGVVAAAPLRLGFYATSCPMAEALITNATEAKWTADPSITAGLLRLYFHDCFVQGCDASILIKSTAQNTAEMDVAPNQQTLHGMDLIDTAKDAVEKACPGIVSCADILALATRDSVVLAGGGTYAVPTGRRDSRVSLASSVNLPGPRQSVVSALPAFMGRGLTLADMVALLGAHTMGVTHCQFFSDRLYNFNNTFRPDPTMDPAQVTLLRSVCPRIFPGLGGTVSLDQGTRFIFDNSFYQELQQNRGILQMDQELSRDPTTAVLVSQLAAPDSNFTTIFGQAMVKLGNVGVLTGARGEIRKICSQIN